MIHSRGETDLDTCDLAGVAEGKASGRGVAEMWALLSRLLVCPERRSMSNRGC